MVGHVPEEVVLRSLLGVKAAKVTKAIRIPTDAKNKNCEPLTSPPKWESHRTGRSSASLTRRLGPPQRILVPATPQPATSATTTKTRMGFMTGDSKLQHSARKSLFSPESAYKAIRGSVMTMPTYVPSKTALLRTPRHPLAAAENTPRPKSTLAAKTPGAAAMAASLTASPMTGYCQPRLHDTCGAMRAAMGPRTADPGSRPGALWTPGTGAGPLSAVPADNKNKELYGHSAVSLALQREDPSKGSNTEFNTRQSAGCGSGAGSAVASLVVGGTSTGTIGSCQREVNPAAANSEAGPMGSVQILSPVKASRGARELLGSDKVLTPVRRSARKSAAKPTTPVAALLQAANFAYMPNAYLGHE